MKIKVPATSANLGVGFDTLGLSVGLYNIFNIEASESFSLHNFGVYNELENNLVYQIYKETIEHFGKDVKPVSITLTECNIPESRGLGSSASCVLAGIFAANEIAQLGMSYEECIFFAADLEGHPDNVFPAGFGGLIAGFKDEDEYYFDQFEISPMFKFAFLIPQTTGKTEVLRRVLPRSIKYHQCISNLSRIVHLPKTLQSGSLKKLKAVLKDQLHEQYRFSYIPLSNKLLELQKDEKLILKISGSGPSILLISTEKPQNRIPQSILEAFDCVELEIGNHIKIEITK